MTDSNLPAPGPERREAAVQRLSALFADGQIELEDMERRMEIVYKARTMAELDGALAGIEPAKPAGHETPVPAPPFRADHPKASARSLAVMSAIVREGRWVPAPRHRAWIVLAGAKLDFRNAELQTGVTEIRLNVMMGGVEIIVPPDLDVEVDGFAVMGAIDRRDLHPAPLEEQSRRLRIHARVVMGGVEVKVQGRDEPVPRSRDQ